MGSHYSSWSRSFTADTFLILYDLARVAAWEPYNLHGVGQGPWVSSRIEPQISSSTNAACISDSNDTYLVSCWPPWTVKEGDIASFFLVQDLGLALAPKMCPDQSQTFKEVNNSQAFTAWRKKTTLFFLDQPLPGAPRHVCTSFEQIFEELTA